MKAALLLLAMATVTAAAAASNSFEAPAGTTLFPAFCVLDEDASTPSGRRSPRADARVRGRRVRRAALRGDDLAAVTVGLR